MTMKFKLGSLVGALLAVTLFVPSLVGQAPQTARQTAAPQLTEKELIALLENAKTPADHEKLAAYYDAEATDFEAKAAKHKRMAEVYRRMPPPGNPRFTDTRAGSAGHCDNIAAESAKAGKEARAMADHHKMLAKEQ